MRKKTLGIPALFLATMIWGTSFVVMKDTLDNIQPLLLLAIRFSMGSLIFAAVCVKKIKAIDGLYIKYGVLTGILLSSAYITQTLGLQLTTPGKNAFLTVVYCIIVPFLCWITDKKRPDKYNVSAAVICLVGIGLITLEGTLSVNIGDLLTLASGAIYSVHIIMVKRASARRPDMSLLTFIQFLTSAVICWCFSPVLGDINFSFPVKSWLSVIYLGIMATSLALFLQNYGQKHTSPSSAAIVLSFEAVFGAAFSLILGYDSFSAKVIAGFAIMFISVIISETRLSFLKRR